MASWLYRHLRQNFPSPDKAAFLRADGSTFCYGDIEDWSARYAQSLIALGVEPGDRVALQVEKSIDAVMVYLGCLRSGAAVLPLNTAYTPIEVEYFLNDATPKIFICDPVNRSALEGAARFSGTRIETMGADGSGSIKNRACSSTQPFHEVSRGSEDLAGILYTSGTTGRAKGAMISHENLASNARTLKNIWRFTPQDVLLHALPIYHTHGLFVAINTLLMAGGAMIFLPRFDPDEIMKHMPRATSMMGVPTFYARLLRHPDLNATTVGHMRLFLSGSAPLQAQTHHEWRERTGHSILERYGMTETNMISSNPYEGERIAGTVGFPLPGVSVRIADPETGAPSSPGEIGMIEVKGPNVFSSYWNMPEKTATEFRSDGYFITGDLGVFDDQNYLKIVGRGKDLVISGGFNVYPKEIEAEIDALPGVVESAVIGLPHKDFGEGVTAIVVCKSDAQLSESLILSALNGRLAKFKQPKKVLFVVELPRNAMGKVQKNILRENYRDLYA